MNRLRRFLRWSRLGCAKCGTVPRVKSDPYCRECKAAYDLKIVLIEHLQRIVRMTDSFNDPSPTEARSYGQR